MNRANFFASLRSRTSGVFGTSLSNPQVQGCEAILDEGQRRGVKTQELAYVLATAYHESAHTMQPVRETLAKTDDGAINALERAWKAGKLKWVKTPYWRKDASGKSWFGRGLVQITHYDNYEKFGITRDPSEALKMPVAIRIIFDGMINGLFTNHKLSDYIGNGKADYYGARRIVNGTDKAAQIAVYAKAFEKALRDAGYVSQAPQPKPSIPEPAPASTEWGKPINKPAPAKSGLAALIAAIVGMFTRKSK